MDFVFICAFLLAFGQYGSAVQVCNKDFSYTSILIPSCVGNDATVYWPNYNDLSTFYKCVVGKPQLQTCPRNQHFTYYYQECTDCAQFLPPPDCEFLETTTGVTCKSQSTPANSTTKPSTTTKVPNPTNVPTTTKVTKRPTTTPSSVPTPPSQGSSTTADIPTPPVVVTPVPGIPTPPNENLTPPNIPATPPMLTTLSSD